MALVILLVVVIAIAAVVGACLAVLAAVCRAADLELEEAEELDATATP